MHVGILTVPLRTKPLDQIIPWAAQHGIRALEIDVSPGSHLDAATTDQTTIERVLDLLQTHDVRISSLGCYQLLTGVPDQQAAAARRLIEQAIPLAQKLNVQTICTLAGFPTAGKTREQTIAEDLPGALRPLLDQAGAAGVRLALENWFATNIQHLDHWRAVFDVLPDAHLGLNFDPSHLDWMGIDVGLAAREFRDRIFHVHAKDVAIDQAKLARVGVNGAGWWRYVLPGYGRIHWGEFIGLMKSIGYDDVLSIEHEDAAWEAEDGFRKAARVLNELV